MTPIARKPVVAAINAVLLTIGFWFTTAAHAQVDPATFVNFEGAQTNPIRLSADRRRLFAVNTPDARLSVFDLFDPADATITPANPRLAAEIPVGIEPVSVNARTSDEVWVVNQESDSISVVSLSRGIVIDTLYVKDEPADVVFVDDLAFVSVARSNQVRVFDARTRVLLNVIPLLGRNPRAMAVNESAHKVYVAFALSGNGTTVIAPPPGTPAPQPTNPSLPPPPETSLIVDARDPAWSHVVTYSMPDFDVAEIDVRSRAVTRYFSNVGTVNLGIAVQPFTGVLYVANTEARNRIAFEPALRGHFVDNRITRVPLLGAPTPIDLNPTIDYAVLPNPGARATALAQPTAVVFEPLGRFMYVAAFGSDHIAVVAPSGTVLGRIAAAPSAAANDGRMRGPRGLALHAAARRLYVLNRISNTITLVDLDAGQAVREIPAGRFDPTPDVVRRGRRVLYDARLSGNGTGSCASCHVDAEMDLIAWNLGNPGGSMQTVSQNGTTFDLHPMKGPMLTQTLRGLRGMAPYHWRGDRAQLADFDGAFATLMGGDTPPAGEMAAFAAFAESIAFMPNPFRRLDRTLPATLNGGDPIRGLGAFNASCDQCHSLRNGGTNLEWRLTPVGHTMKVPHLRNIYQRLGSPRSEGMIAVEGFGLGHDGSFAMLDDVLANPMMGQLAEDPGLRKDVAAFVMSFDTGTAPAVGFSVTLTAATMDEGRLAVLTALEQQAAVGNIDLIAKGTLLDGGVRGLLYRPASDEYTPDTREVAALARDAILERVRTGIDVVTFMGVPAGSGERMGIDRDLDGELDGYQRGRVP